MAKAWTMATRCEFRQESRKKLSMILNISRIYNIFEEKTNQHNLTGSKVVCK
jgi:hypothetical protein